MTQDESEILDGDAAVGRVRLLDFHETDAGELDQAAAPDTRQHFGVHAAVQHRGEDVLSRLQRQHLLTGIDHALQNVALDPDEPRMVAPVSASSAVINEADGARPGTRV